MALMLHQKAKTQMKKGMYKEALDVLIMAEVHCYFVSYHVFYLAYVIIVQSYHTKKHAWIDIFFVVVIGSFLSLWPKAYWGNLNIQEYFH